MDSMNPQVVVVTRLKAAREAEKRKGDDGILVNTTTETENEKIDMLVEDSEIESRLENENKEDKLFVKLNSRVPSKEVKDDEWWFDKEKLK